jgi:RNase H-like protein
MESERTELQEVTIHTDGSCIGNPGPGGYGVVLEFGHHQKTLSGGYRLTTSKRMEAMALIVGLKALKRRCKVTILPGFGNPGRWDQGADGLQVQGQRLEGQKKGQAQ